MSIKLLGKSVILILGLAFVSCTSEKKGADRKAAEAGPARQEWAIVIHGGAGDITLERLTPALDKQFRASLEEGK